MLATSQLPWSTNTASVGFTDSPADSRLPDQSHVLVNTTVNVLDKILLSSPDPSAESFMLYQLYCKLEITPMHACFALHIIHKLAGLQNISMQAHPRYTLLIAALSLSDKYLNDDRFSNKSWARITQVDNTILNNLEMTICSCLSWKLNVGQAAFLRWLCLVEECVEN